MLRGRYKHSMLYALIDAGSGGWLPLNLTSHYTALGFVMSTFFSLLYTGLLICALLHLKLRTL